MKTPAPPPGSSILVNMDNGFPTVVIPSRSNPLLRIPVALFLLMWLGGWATGWWSAAQQLLSGQLAAQLFLVFWLGGWTLGGIMAMWFFYRLVRPSIPEQLTLYNQYIEYDSGIPAFPFLPVLRSFGASWRLLFPKRKRLKFDSNSLHTLKLREHPNGNRLTIDLGAERLELASGSGEVEKEWLHQELTRKYS